MKTEIIYGLNPVLEVLKASRRRCHSVYIASNRREKDVCRVTDETLARRIPLKTIPADEFAKMVGAEKHQGVAVRVDPYNYIELEDVTRQAMKDSRKGFILILDGVADPHNLGSLTRTAYLLGVHGIVLPCNNSASVTPAVVKVSAGATEYMKISRVINISRAINILKEFGFRVIGAEAKGLESLYQFDFRGDHITLVLGSEGSGIRRLVRESCDHLLNIPMEGKIASYNTSIAGAIFMAEVSRQRSFSSPRKNHTEWGQIP